MESRSFPSSFDIARRYAKHWKQYYLRYGEQGFDLSGGTTRPSYISLGHEMGHGSDANQGLLHFSSDYTNGNGVQYQSTYQGLLKSEWRAVYRENLIRGQAGVSLRTNYGIDMSTGVPLPAGPRLLDATNQPLNYP